MKRNIFGKFTLTKDSNDQKLKVYQHVDNGGHSFAVDCYGNLSIETGFFGYSNTTLDLTEIDIDGLIDFLVYSRNFQFQIEK